MEVPNPEDRRRRFCAHHTPSTGDQASTIEISRLTAAIGRYIPAPYLINISKPIGSQKRIIYCAADVIQALEKRVQYNGIGDLSTESCDPTHEVTPRIALSFNASGGFKIPH